MVVTDKRGILPSCARWGTPHIMSIFIIQVWDGVSGTLLGVCGGAPILNHSAAIERFFNVQFVGGCLTCDVPSELHWQDV
jgi:ABC-type lipoprotein release transport system permease subunit